MLGSSSINLRFTSPVLLSMDWSGCSPHSHHLNYYFEVKNKDNMKLRYCGGKMMCEVFYFIIP